MVDRIDQGWDEIEYWNTGIVGAADPNGEPPE